jgi:hypothetical protein
MAIPFDQSHLPSLFDTLMMSLENASQRGHLVTDLAGAEYATIVTEVEGIIFQLQSMIAADDWSGLQLT